LNVSLDPTANTSSQTASTASAASNGQTTAQQSGARAQKATETPAANADLTTATQQQSSSQTSSANNGEPQTAVTFRKDDAGQVYYVLTDSESGKEIREVPPAEIRKVGEGIAEFLKQEAAKGSSATHVKVKA
jgi:uncharacterized FlaG/YvyC family protein